MKISELSDEELSRWIAEKLEPNPHWTCGTHTDGQAYTIHPFKQTLTPRNMVTDPAMTLMLMGEARIKAIPQHDGTWAAQAWSSPRMGSGINVGRAVAEAYALANGWTYSL